MRTTRETIGRDRYVTGWQLVRRPVDPPKWQPPAQPCGAWLPVKPLDTLPPRDGNPLSSHTQHVWLVRRNGTQTEGFWCDWLGWQARIGAGFLDFDDADTAEFIGWRGMR